EDGIRSDLVTGVQTCALPISGHVAEGSVLIVVVELGRSRAHLGVPGPVFTVDQQNVGIAVIVVIDEGAAGAHGFRQVFFSEGGRSEERRGGTAGGGRRGRGPG